MNTNDIRIIICIALVLVLVFIVMSSLKKGKSKNSDKAARWHALPIRFKLICWFCIMPLFFAGFIPLVIASGWWQLLSFAIWILSLVSHAALEIACVRWYNKNGLFPTYDHEKE